MQIEVSFPVWKALTAHRTSEHETYDDVLRRLLEVDGQSHAEPQNTPSQGKSAVYRGVALPHGTRLRATHKGKTFEATIRDGEWVDGDGKERRNSPSEAAHRITGTSVNGWQFWSAQRPGEARWTRLAELR